MPAARYHRRATLTTAAALTLAAPLYVPEFGLPALALIPGCLAGLAIHPDLDQRRAPRSAWRWWWNGYAWLVPHRHCLSHCAGLGTLTRLAWLLVVPFGVAVVAGGAWLIGWIVTQSAVWWFVAGLVLADSLHVLLDRLF